MALAKEILIVDDEVGIRELLSEILQDEGYRVALAENAARGARVPPAAAARAGAARHLDARHRRRHAAARMGGRRPAHDAGRDDVRARHDRDRRRRDEDRRVRLPREAGRPRRSSCRRSRARSRARRRRSRAASRSRRSARALRSATPSARSSTLIAGRRPILILGEPGTGHDIAARALQIAGRAVGRAAERAAPHRESARASRGGARWRAVLRGDRPVLEDRAEGPRVPAAEARQAERDARVHEQRAARQSRRRGQVRSRAAGAARRPARCCCRRCASGARTFRC